VEIMSTATAIDVRGDPNVTRALLACGVVAGPLFIVVAFGQAFTRSGFDFKFHPVSLLDLGSLGWIQIANFMVTGVLYGASAVGIRRALYPGRAGTWGPLLMGVFAVALIGGGVFVPDPAAGFPPGTPAGSVTWHGILHNFAAPMAFIALSVAFLLFAWRFAKLGQRGWAWSCVVVWLLLWSPDLFFGRDWFSLVLALAAAVGWGWASVITARLMTELRV
jgi:hypothetical protein